MQRLIPAILLSFTFPMLLSACSVYMAATGPGKKDLDVLQLGSPRHQILAEFGAPAQSRTNTAGELEDTWTFRQGSSMWWKFVRVLFHSGADVFTLGLWEVVGTPSEMLLKKKETTFVTTYDENEHITSISSAGGALGTINASAPGRPKATASRSPDDIRRKLDAVYQLFEEGLLSREEYDEKRARILGAGYHRELRGREAETDSRR